MHKTFFEANKLNLKKENGKKVFDDDDELLEVFKQIVYKKYMYNSNKLLLAIASSNNKSFLQSSVNLSPSFIIIIVSMHQQKQKYQ